MPVTIKFTTTKDLRSRVDGENPLEKMVAAQLVPKVKFEETTKLQQKTKERIHMDLRQELFTKQNENLRKRKSLSVDVSEPSDVEEDMDTLLKYHHSVQEKIADNMLVLAQSIKEQSLLANSIIRTDTRNVEKSARLADSNYNQLKQESDKLQEENKRAWRCWLWLLLIVVLVIFIQMVLFMRVMKK